MNAFAAVLFLVATATAIFELASAVAIGYGAPGYAGCGYSCGGGHHGGWGGGFGGHHGGWGGGGWGGGGFWG